MKSILIFLLGFQLAAGFIQTETALITLDHGFTWKAMFDAGFRPFHDGDGRFVCRQMNIHVQIRKQEGGEILDLGTGDVEFSLRDNHLLDLLSFYGREYRTVAEVEEKSEVFARVFGDAVNQKSKIAWFETKHSVDYGGRKLEPPQIIRQVDDKDAVTGAKIGDLSVVYSFYSGNARERPMLERISFSLGSPLAYKSPRLKTKIQPPAGYEHVSLEEKTDKSPKASNSSDPENSTASSRPEKIRPTTADNSINASSKESAPFPWWLIASSIAIFVIALAAWLKLRKAKPTP